MHCWKEQIHITPSEKTPIHRTHKHTQQCIANVQCRPQQPQTQTQAPTRSTYTGENVSWGRPGKPSFYAAALPPCDRVLACLQGQRTMRLLLTDLTHASTQRWRTRTECPDHTIVFCLALVCNVKPVHCCIHADLTHLLTHSAETFDICYMGGMWYTRKELTQWGGRSYGKRFDLIFA